MLNKFKQGFKSGLMLFLGVCVSGLFAFTVSGTIKTWTTGDTLTATDLNTTVQSLKAAVEGATQIGQIMVPRRTVNTGVTYGPFLTSSISAASATNIEPQNPMLRSGTVKSVRMDILEAVNMSCAFTLRKNGVDTAVQFNYVANSTTAMTDSDTVSFVATDVLTWKADCPTTGINPLPIVISFQF